MGQAVEGRRQLGVDHIHAGALAADVDHVAALEQAGILVLVGRILLGKVVAQILPLLGVGGLDQRVEIHAGDHVQLGSLRMRTGKLGVGVHQNGGMKIEIVQVDGLGRDKAKVGGPADHAGGAARHGALGAGVEHHWDDGAGGKHGNQGQKQHIALPALSKAEPSGALADQVEGGDRQEVEDD